MEIAIFVELYKAIWRAVGTTQLHKIVVVYKGMDMPVCEEV